MLDKEFNKIVQQFNGKADIELIRSIYNNRLNDEKFDTACENLEEQSAVGWNAYEEFPGDILTNFKNGFQKFLDYFISKLKIYNLNEQVEIIDWTATNSKNGKIQINTLKSIKNERFSYSADYVLCTISLGALKNTHMTLFKPELPSDKIKAINKIGFGVVDKIFLDFGKPVFVNSKDVQGMQIFWKNGIDFQLSAKCPNNDSLNRNGFYKIIDNFNVLPNNPNITYTFVVGEDAKFMENLSDECLNNVIFDLLQKAFPTLKLPKPIKMYRYY